jgi:hypothetical protein
MGHRYHGPPTLDGGNDRPSPESRTSVENVARPVYSPTIRIAWKRRRFARRVTVFGLTRSPTIRKGPIMNPGPASEYQQKEQIATKAGN